MNQGAQDANEDRWRQSVLELLRAILAELKGLREDARPRFFCPKHPGIAEPCDLCIEAARKLASGEET